MGKGGSREGGVGNKGNKGNKGESRDGEGWHTGVALLTPSIVPHPAPTAHLLGCQ